MEVIARISSGSLNVQEGDISYYVSCKVSYSDGSATFATVDSGTANSLELDGTDITTGTEITAGTTFKFEIDLGLTDTHDVDDNVDAGNGVYKSANEITHHDFALGRSPGCDAEAGTGQSLEIRLVVDGGGETLATLEIDSLVLGSSLM